MQQAALRLGAPAAQWRPAQAPSLRQACCTRLQTQETTVAAPACCEPPCCRHRAPQPQRQRRRRRGAAAAAAVLKRFEGRLTADPGTHVGIVVGKFNSLVTDRLLDGALAALRATGVDENCVTIAHVPGSFELPVVATSMAQSGAYQAVICIGAVVRGATTHYEEVCSAATSGCLSAGQNSGVPVIFGVITTDTMEQALDRAGGKVGNKGYEAAITAVEMATLMAQLRASGLAAPAAGQALTI